MKDLSKRFVVEPGAKVNLSRLKTDDTAGIKDRPEAAGVLQQNIRRLEALQYLLYAEGKRSLLVVLQGMDAAGKDGTIRHVMTGLNPQGCHVTAFKEPSAADLAHDFLWRIHQAVPARGDIGIFNRSHYEDVLVVRVHSLVEKSIWKKRYDQINSFEKMLSENGTYILKFFLHISRKEQTRRLRERLADPAKQWKLSEGDLSERKLWSAYQEAYADALQRCSTAWAPWHVIPADHKWFRDFAVSSIIADHLQKFGLKIPRPKVNLSTFKL
jgi:PPK2 family polyphosphate:nucleotide phosphotransferase